MANARKPEGEGFDRKNYMKEYMRQRRECKRCPTRDICKGRSPGLSGCRLERTPDMPGAIWDRPEYRALLDASEEVVQEELAAIPEEYVMTGVIQKGKHPDVPLMVKNDGSRIPVPIDTRTYAELLRRKSKPEEPCDSVITRLCFGDHATRDEMAEERRRAEAASRAERKRTRRVP